MPNVFQVGGIVNEPPHEGGGRRVFTFVIALIRCAIFLIAAYLIWKYVSAPAGKAKLHGYIITGLSFLFTLQEFLFFQARNRLSEPVKSLAVSPRNLEEMLARCNRLKAYLDKAWIRALACKIGGLVAGPLLIFGVVSGVTFSRRGLSISAETVLAMIGWFVVFMGAHLTLRTFRVFRHIDRVQSQLETETRQIVSAQQAADALRKTPVEDWTKDASLSGYKRNSPRKE